MEQNVELVAKHTEFETKYQADGSVLPEFKRIMQGLPDLKEFVYVEGSDEYYTNTQTLDKLSKFHETLSEKNKELFSQVLGETIMQQPPFFRFRKPALGFDQGRKEITTKFKRPNAKNNIQREEKNLRVDLTNNDTISAFLKDMGYSLNFEIWKTSHIYNFTDATLVFYSVYDITENVLRTPKHFIEIEVDEDLVSTLTEEQAWGIITKYEAMLETFDISARNRLKKSLFEMYRR